MKKLFLSMACLALLQTAQATIITVNNEVGSSADYNNIASAVSFATNGDTIYVQPAMINYGSFTLDKSLVIMGAGHNPSFSPYNSAFTNITLQTGASGAILKGININRIFTSDNAVVNNVVISGCRINSSSNPLTISTGSYNNWIFEGCIIEAGGTSINLTNMGSNLIFRNNFMQSYVTNYVTFNTPSGTLFDHNILMNMANSPYYGVVQGSNITLTNNVILSDATSNYGADYGCSMCSFNNNLTFSNGNASFPTLSGSGNLNNQSPAFVSFNYATGYQYSFDLNIGVGSSANNAATDGTDIGVYGGIFNFDPNGIDGGSPHINSFTLNSATAPQGGTITIHLNASGSGQ